jgi:hypothetical protein
MDCTCLGIWGTVYCLRVPVVVASTNRPQKTWRGNHRGSKNSSLPATWLYFGFLIFSQLDRRSMATFSQPLASPLILTSAACGRNQTMKGMAGRALSAFSFQLSASEPIP